MQSERFIFYAEEATDDQRDAEPKQKDGIMSFREFIEWKERCNRQGT